MSCLKKYTTASLSLLMIFMFILCGCNNGTDNSLDNKDKAKETVQSVEKVFEIGICQSGSHPALEKAKLGFTEEIIKKMGKNKVRFDEENAEGDLSAAKKICSRFVEEKKDLILANATPALQAAHSVTDSIPIMGTSITSYGYALGINGWKGYSEMNISGTSDLPPLNEQANMVKDLFPNKKKIGIFYSSQELNSEYQYAVIKPQLEQEGFNVRSYTYKSVKEMSEVLKTACKKSELLFIPTDNTAATNAKIIDKIASENKVPVVTGEENMCKVCGTVTVSIDYKKLGKVTADMAYEVLKNSKDISTMEVQFAPTMRKYNKEKCRVYGLKVSKAYKPL